MKSQGKDSQSGGEQIVSESVAVPLLSARGRIKVDPSKKEKEQLQNLFEWRVKSEKTQWILGRPLSY